MKGQSFEVFKMLIGAIFSISILIIGLVYITNLFLPINSYYQLKEGLKNAYNVPGEDIENIIFYKKGQIFQSDQFKINVLFESNVQGKIRCVNDRKCVVLGDCSVLTKFKCFDRNTCKITFEKLKE